jgi:hypothetical protein
MQWLGRQTELDHEGAQSELSMGVIRDELAQSHMHR